MKISSSVRFRLAPPKVRPVPCAGVPRLRSLGMRVALGAALLGLAGPAAVVGISHQLSHIRHFNAMSAREQSTYRELERFGGRRLNGLLDSGRLLDRDSAGKSTLDHLEELKNGNVAAGLRKPQVFAELVANLDEPGNTQQHNRGTCAITSVEYLHAKLRPSDYARVVNGLVREAGRVPLADGEILERNASGYLPDDSGRTSVDRVYQSSLSGFASHNEGLIYTNAGSGGQMRPNGRIDHSGTTGSEAAHALRAVLDESYRCRGRMGPASGDAHFCGEIARGHQPEVFLQWTTGQHALVVEKIEGDSVCLRNPWGAGDTGSSSDGPPRQVVDSHTGMIRMSKQDFYSRLLEVID